MVPSFVEYICKKFYLDRLGFEMMIFQKITDAKIFIQFSHLDECLLNNKWNTKDGVI